MFRRLLNKLRHPGAHLAPHAGVSRSTLGAHTVIHPHARVIGCTLGDHCAIHPHAELYNTTLEHHIAIHPRVQLTDSVIGAHTYIARETYLNAVRIGRFCSIGPRVLAGTGEHPANLLTTSPEFYSPRAQTGHTFCSDTDCPPEGSGGTGFQPVGSRDRVARASSPWTAQPPGSSNTDFQPVRPAVNAPTPAPRSPLSERLPIHIGHDVWIGAHAFIRDGVTIHDGAIIAAGAVVTHDIPAYHIYGGVPARPIRPRFSADIIAQLQSLAWWDWPDETLRAAQPHLASPDPAALFAFAEKRPRPPAAIHT